MKLASTLVLCTTLSLSPAAFAQVDHPIPGKANIPPTKVIPIPQPEVRPQDIQPVKADHPQLYDERADARKQIAAAMKAAGKENRRVLIQWGGNWCSWCHLLHAKFQKDPELRKLLSYEYDIVLVDAGKNGKNLDLARVYKADVINGGYPYLTILDAAGTVLANEETGQFEAKGESAEKPGHDGAKLLAFLKSHQAPPRSAEAVLKEARDAAKMSSRKVFLHFGAPWCGWCKRLEAWLAREDVAARFGKDFVEVKIDQDRMTGAKDVFARYCKNYEKSGIPWFVIVDAATGEPVSTSDGPKGNIGFPATPEEIAHFVTMLKAAATKMNDSDIELLKRTLEEGRK